VIPEPTMSPKKLTPKQQRFVDEYLVDLNAAGAARRAGYSEKWAKCSAEELMRKPAIQSRMKDMQQRTEVTADRWVRELAAMAFYDPADLGSAEIKSPADIKLLPEQVRRAIIGWSWDKYGNFVLKLSPKTPSLDLLGRHLGLLTTKLEVTGKDGQPLQTQRVPADLTGLTDDELDALERIASKLGGHPGGTPAPDA
jgi:phage terminase small subunit